MTWPYYQIPGEIDTPYGVTDVSRFGPIGTSDDTDTINRALANVTAGGVLYFPPVRYYTRGGHVLSKPCTIIGPGRGYPYDTDAQLYLLPASNADILTVEATNVTFRDFSIYGNGANQSGASNGLVYSPTIPCNYGYIDNLRVDSCKTDNLLLQAPGTSLGLNVVGLESRLAGQYGIHIVYGASDCQFAAGFVDQCGASGVYVDAASSRFNNYHVWGNGTAAGSNRDGFTLANTHANAFSLTASYVESQTGGYGIRVGSSNVANSVIANNVFYLNYKNAIYLYSANGVIIQGNRCWQNNQNGTSGYAGASIVLDGTCVGIATVGNMLGNAVSPGQTYGYAENGTTHTNCLLDGNVAPDGWSTVDGYLVPTGSSTTIGTNVGTVATS